MRREQLARAFRSKYVLGFSAMLPSIVCSGSSHDPPERAFLDPSISHADAATTPRHFAYKYLTGMRSSRGVSHHIIDGNGNFNDNGRGEEGWVPVGGKQHVVVHAGNSWENAMPFWEDEWRACEYNSSLLKKWLLCSSAFVLLATLATAMSPLGSNPEDCFAGSFTVRGAMHRALAYSPFYLVCALLLVTRWIPDDKFDRYYPAIVICWVVALNFSVLLLGILREVTRDLSAGQAWEQAPPDSLCAKTAHVSVITNFSAFPPTRICLDRDPVRTVTKWPFVHSVGCASLMLDATFPRNIEMLFVFYLMRSQWRTALTGTLITLALLLSVGIATGQHERQLFYFALLHTSVGCVITVLCNRGTQESRKTFAMVKKVKLAARQSQKSLHTLIPPTVLARLASHSHDMGILGTEIEQCTVMFVSFDEAQGDSVRPEHAAAPSDCLHDDVSAFRRLHSMLLEFDEAVADSRLYKYQHVGEFYIITCTNAAEPFNLAGAGGAFETRRPARGGTGQDKHCLRGAAVDMVSLAVEFATIARGYGFRLRVGINSGKAAGAVIGKVRAFYCIYGSTVNTASRLCKYADRGQVCCSREFMRCLEAERAAGASPGAKGTDLGFSPRGCIHLKGIREGLDAYSASLTRTTDQGAQGSWCAPPHTYAEASADVALFNVDAFWGGRAGLSPQSPQTREREGVAVAEVSRDELLFNVDAFSRGGVDGRRRLGVEGGGGLSAPERRRRNSTRVDMHDSWRSLSDDGDLSAQSKALLDQEQISLSQRPMSYGFEDSSLEERFMEDQAGVLRYRICAGLVVHLLGVGFQMVLMLDPPHASDSKILGPVLTRVHQEAVNLLAQHLVVQSVVGCLVAYALWRRPARWTEGIGIVLGTMRLGWLLMSGVACAEWPMKHYVTGFAALYSLSQFIIVSLPFRSYIFFWVLSHLAYFFFGCQSREIVTAAFVVRFMCTSASIWMFNILAEDRRRRQWKLHQVFQLEMKRLNDILDDLLPLRNAGGERCGQGEFSRSRGEISLDVLVGISSGVDSCWQRHAVVLQFDVCGFTEMSQKMSALELAEIMHHIFSAFDSTVESLRLFKMDTVGDAYIVAAWLVAEEADEGGRNGGAGRGGAAQPFAHGTLSPQQARQSCHKMLYLAGTMLDMLSDYHTKGGDSVSARIGLGIGRVIVGALGSLQPRVHLMGAGMREAQALEQQGRPGMVHASAAFVERLLERKVGVGALAEIAADLHGWKVDEVRTSPVLESRLSGCPQADVRQTSVVLRRGSSGSVIAPERAPFISFMPEQPPPVMI